jgi:Peptidase M15
MSNKPLITLEQYLTASGSYPDRAKHPELTKEFLANAELLLSKVNSFLVELGVGSCRISSGFRPTAINATVKGAAKKSLHTQCKAVDLVDDKDQSLSKLVLSKPELLKKYGLWIEDPGHTKGKYSNWTHLDIGTRKPREIQVFKP